MERIYWLWLSMLPYVGPILQKKLLDSCGTPENVYLLNEEELKNCFTEHGSRVGSSRAVESISQNRSLEKAKRINEVCVKKNISIVTIDHPNYSMLARPCPESPIVLYVKGTLKQTQTSVAIVGSRRCSAYGKKITQQIAAEISNKNVAIISGMAKGIDGYAHTTAIKNGGYTIAFLANGVDLCYPAEHRILYEAMIDNGAILSKYPPGTIAYPKYFLERNALISAWAEQLIIIEAGERSGALTTAKFAHKYNREIFAVPNRIDNPSGMGSNKLLETIAKPYLGIHSLKGLGETSAPKIQKEDFLLPNEIKLLSILEQVPRQIVEVQKLLNISQVNFEELIFKLELKGKVKIYGEFILLK